MLNVIIVEDERHSRESLKNLLTEFCRDVQVVDMAASVEEAIQQVKKHHPDLIFLDIELQSGTGFDVLEALQNENFEIIFTTAFEQYAIKAIKFSSIDYLLKPIDIEELQDAVERAKMKKDEEEYQRQRDVLLQNFKQPKGVFSKICLSTSEGIEFISVGDILYCEANGSYTDFHLQNNKKIVVSKNLKEYENMLPDSDFLRVHNSFLINLNAVKKFVKSDGGYILMENDATVTISPKKRDLFFEKMARA